MNYPMNYADRKNYQVNFAYDRDKTATGIIAIDKDGQGSLIKRLEDGIKEMVPEVKGIIILGFQEL